MSKPGTSYEFIAEWFAKARDTAKAQRRNDSAALWADGLEHLEHMKQQRDELAEVVEAIEMAMRLPGVTAAEVLDLNSPIRAAIRAALAKYRQPQEEAPELFPGTLDALRDLGKQREAPPSPDNLNGDV